MQFWPLGQRMGGCMRYLFLHPEKAVLLFFSAIVLISIVIWPKYHDEIQCVLRAAQNTIMGAL
jgi:hypothetical protein